MKIEEKVARNDQKYRQLTPDTFADTVWVIDIRTLNVLYVSPETFETRGFSAEETIGKNISDFLTRASCEKISLAISEAISDFHENKSKTYTLEIEVFHKEGFTLWIEFKTKLIQEENKENGRLKFVGISRNITDRKHAEDDREQLTKKLNNALEEKEKLLGKIKLFESLLPICSACRRIRHSDHSWWPIEKYIEEKAGSQFTHTICPDCSSIYYEHS